MTQFFPSVRALQFIFSFLSPSLFSFVPFLHLFYSSIPHSLAPLCAFIPFAASLFIAVSPGTKFFPRLFLIRLPDAEEFQFCHSIFCEEPAGETNCQHFSGIIPVIFLYSSQGLLYHSTCKRDFLCSWPSLNSYLK